MTTVNAYQVYCRIVGYSQDRAPVTCIGIQIELDLKYLSARIEGKLRSAHRNLSS